MTIIVSYNELSIANYFIAKETYFWYKIYSVETFRDWLLNELKKRGWSQSELAKRAGLAPSTISNILNANKGLGEVSLSAIAKALNVPTEIVFRAAGFLPKAHIMTEQKEEILYLFDKLSEQEKKDAIRYLRFLIDAQEKN